MAPLVIVVGDVMADVIVRPLGAFAEGSDTPCEIVVAPGGSAANEAVWMAAAGAEAHLVGVVGDDALGAAASDALGAAGVTAHLSRDGHAATGVVVALVDGAGQRSMLTDRGANRRLVESVLPAGLFSAPAHLHLSGYELLDEATRQPALRLLERAEDAGMTRSVNPCSAGPLAGVGGASFLGWTEGVEWCCANLDEGRVLTGAEDPREVLETLRLHYREVTLTLGAGGALAAGPDTSCLRVPAQAAEAVDTTGAGDAFTGTFLARRLAGDGLEAATRAGLAAAAGVVTSPGARRWAEAP